MDNPSEPPFGGSPPLTQGSGLEEMIAFFARYGILALGKKSNGGQIMEMMKRAIHLDFHTMPGIYDFEETFDPVAFAQTLKDAKVEYINAVAQCNLGFCYFPTNVGVRYPYLKTDLFGSIIGSAGDPADVEIMQREI